MKNILVVGDSFTYGEGCSDRSDKQIVKKTENPSEKCWASKLQRDLPQYNIINKSIPGNSPLGIYNTIDLALKDYSDISLIIYSGTFQNRMLVASYYDTERLANWVMGFVNTEESLEYNRAKEYFIKYLYNDNVMRISAECSFMGAYGFAKMNDIEFLYSMPTEPGNDIIEMSYARKDIQFTHLYDFIYDENPELLKTCIAPDGKHPNDLGHDIYYEKVIKTFVLNYIKENI